MSKKHKHDHEEHVDESWLIPYADLLTLLLALFIVLFATSKNLDMKKVDAMQKVFQSVISGGLNVFDFYAPIDTTKQQEEKTKSPEEILKELEETMKQQALLMASPSPTATNMQDQASPSPDVENNKGKSEDEKQFDEESKVLEDLKKKLDDFIEKQNMQMQLQTSLNKSQLSITIRDQALFPPGSADLKAQSIELAKEISSMLAPYQQFQVRVGGHTDDLPINNGVFQSNWDLSSKRAINFLKILLGNQIIDPKNYSAVGYAEFQPIADNQSADGRSKNRRVEISILRNVIDNEGQIQRQPVTP